MAEAARPHLLRDLQRAAGLGPSGWYDLARAGVELARARRLMGTRTTKQLIAAARNEAPMRSPDSLSEHQRRMIRRVAFAVPRVGVRVPWRADCLVQALAAQRWLRQEGIATTLHIGARKETAADFEAHAWLMHGDTIVTGDNGKEFTTLVAP